MQTVVPDTSRQDAPKSTPDMVHVQPPRQPKRPMTTTIGTVLSWVVAGLLLGAAGIHFGMMGEHAGVSWTHGVFFGVVAWLQLALAVAIVTRRSRPVVAAVIVCNLAVLGVWLLTRTVGIAIGSDGTPEAWGTIDGVCAALEGLAIVASLGLLAPRFARRPLSASVGLGGAAFVAVLVAALVTFVFSPASAGGGGSSADGHSHGGGVPVSADGHQHGSAALAPVGGHTHGGPTTLNGQPVQGVKAQDVAAEAQPDQPLDPATRATLQAQLMQARDVAERYPTVADGVAGGYGILAGGFAPGSGAHYITYSSLTGGGAFQPGHPLSLIYDGTSPTSRIVGLMYYGIGEQAPEGFAGPNDHWHRHSNVCIKYGSNGVLGVPFPADADVTAAQCEAAKGSLMKVTGWMVHAWVVPSWESPLGVFSHDNPNVRCADNTYKTNKAGLCQGT
jgi:hypothetical protein